MKKSRHFFKMCSCYLPREALQPAEAAIQRCSSEKCSRNMQQIYRRTPMPKCDFNKIAKQFCWNHTLAWVFSCKFVAYFQNSLEHLWMAASEPATSPTQKEGFFCKSITAQKMKFSIKDFPIKYDQIRRKLRLLEKPLMENFILCAVNSWKNNRKCLKIIRSQL